MALKGKGKERWICEDKRELLSSHQPPSRIGSDDIKFPLPPGAGLIS